MARPPPNTTPRLVVVDGKSQVEVATQCFAVAARLLESSRLAGAGKVLRRLRKAHCDFKGVRLAVGPFVGKLLESDKLQDENLWTALGCAWWQAAAAEKESSGEEFRFSGGELLHAPLLSDYWMYHMCAGMGSRDAVYAYRRRDDFVEDFSNMEIGHVWRCAVVRVMDQVFRDDPKLTAVVIQRKMWRVTWSFHFGIRRMMWMAIVADPGLSTVSSPASSEYIGESEIERWASRHDMLDVVRKDVGDTFDARVLKDRRPDSVQDLFRALRAGMTASDRLYASKVCRVCSSYSKGDGTAMKPLGLLRCTRCRSRTAVYCSRECQVADWPRHRREECVERPRR